MSFIEAPYLPTGYSLRIESFNSWSVLRNNGPFVDNLQHLGLITKETDHYLANIHWIHRKTFSTFEEAALWICHAPMPDLTPLGLEAFGHRALKVLWRHDRGYFFSTPCEIPPSSVLEKAFFPHLEVPVAAPPIALVGEVMESNKVFDQPRLGLVLWNITTFGGFRRVSCSKSGWTAAYQYRDLLHKRATRKSLKDLLLIIARDTYALVPQTSTHARLQDQEEALASLDGIDARVQAYFDTFEDYKLALKDPLSRSF